MRRLFMHINTTSLAWTVLAATTALAEPPDDFRLPYRQPPVDYFGDRTDEPVGRLRENLARGDVRLEFDEQRGYLPALLRALKIPVESQMLVFAKNSVHARLISPDNPRALYFNDEVYVGWVPGAPMLEISAVDPQKGAVFYTLSQAPGPPARLERQESCLLCHASTNTLSIPGHVVRSFLTDSQGNPTRGYSRVTDALPLSKHFGGWYVTGDWGAQPHWGNQAAEKEPADRRREPDAPGTKARLEGRLGVSKYLSSKSDIVALLVHEHQTHVHNLLTRVNFEERLRRWQVTRHIDGRDTIVTETEAAPTTASATEEELIRALLCIDSADFASPIEGDSGFAEQFERLAPVDAKGRSLRQLDLQTRLFKHRCSYLIRSHAFRALPEPARSRIAGRLRDVLSAGNPPAAYATIPHSERATLVEMLADVLELKHAPRGD